MKTIAASIMIAGFAIAASIVVVNRYSVTVDANKYYVVDNLKANVRVCSSEQGISWSEIIVFGYPAEATCIDLKERARQ